MLWFFHCWLSFLGISLLVFNGCQCLFLRHSETGKCITASEELAHNVTDYSFPYFVVMTDNCLDSKVQFRYLGTELLHNIEKDGTLVSARSRDYHGRWAVYKGVATNALNYQKNAIHRLKQTAAGSLFFYKSDDPVCAEPSSKYLLRKTYCDTTQQKFTFGSVTAFNAKMNNVHCSPKQLMMVESANYGDFDKNIDSQCSRLTNCQVKSLCGGKRSCELTMDNNLLPSKYCPDTSKELYNKYTCVDIYNSSAITTATNIRLTNGNQGYIEIKDGSIWRKVVEKNWDENRQKMLCQHLGFEEITGNNLETRQLPGGEAIATGDLICYNTQLNGTSCCVHLEPSTTTRSTVVPAVTCKVCDNPLLHNTTTFPDSVFSGSGDSSNKYENVRISEDGWCSSGTGYLLLDLKKEYHITKVVVMAGKEQTKWSGSYILKYSNDTTYKKTIQISGNQNGYQASRTSLDIYNVRHVKIQSTSDKEFCLRMELCGEVQTPAPVSNIIVSPPQYSATVTWEIPRSVQDSSYITQTIIYLNGQVHKTISRGTQVGINGLSPDTLYVVGIQTWDGSSQKSEIVIQPFRTKEVNAEESSEEKIQKDLLIPLVIFVLISLLLLGVIIYQRRLIRNNNRQLCQNCACEADQKIKSSNNKTVKTVKTAADDLDMNDDGAYESADYVVKAIGENEAESQRDSGREPSTYMSLKDNREPENVYQPLQHPNVHTVEYENPTFTSSKET